MNINSFSKYVGVNEGTTRNYIDRGSKPGIEYLEKVFRSVEGLNASWLLTGEGDPFIKGGNSKEKDTQLQVFTNGTEKHHELQHIPLYDITASAGLNALYNSSNNILDYIQIPNLPRCDGAIYVKGDSMYPLLKHGDMVAFQRLVDLPDEIDFGNMYVVDMSTPNLERVYVKYVQKSELGDKYVKLVSYNEKHHPPKDVLLSKIRAMAAVKASIRLA
ncbi:S24 family peptidase [Rufibacter soli]